MSNRTNEMTEAAFEAHFSGVLKDVFPWAGKDALTHQTTFTIRLGHKDIELGGKAKTAQGRSDILIKQDDTPLAILELKRPGIELQDDDVQQGLSYAKLLSPPAPLLVVSNGDETHIYDTYTGEELADSSIHDEAQLTAFFSNAAKIAKNNKEHAVQALLGPNDKIWQKVFADLSMEALEELTGEMSDLRSPLVQDFLIPRTVTPQLLGALKTNARVLVLHGPPMSGKTSVLVELFQSLDTAPDFIPLFIEAEDCSEGILRIIANRLSTSLGLSLDKEQVRTWLRGASSNISGPTIVLMVDEVNGARIKEELTELTSKSYGGKLKLVVAINDGDPESLLSRGGRRHKPTALARRAKEFQIGPFDDVEIRNAEDELRKHQILLEKGYHHSGAYRSPWLLRSIAADASAAHKKPDSTSLIGIPAVLGLHLFGVCANQFADDLDLKSTYRSLAQAIVQEHNNSEKFRNTILHMMHMFLVHEETIKKYFAHDEIRELEKEGLLKKHMVAGEIVFIPRLQEFLAAELSLLLSERIKPKAGSHSEASKFLVRLSSTLPLGDIIAANAVAIAYTQRRMSEDFLAAMFFMTPEKETIKPGTRFEALIPFDGGAGSEASVNGGIVLRCDPEELPVAYKNTQGWLILSHLAAHHMEAPSNESGQQRIDGGLLIEIGSCPFPLLRPQGTNLSHHTHESPDGETYLCGCDGLIEPITQSMFQSMSRDRIQGEAIINEALKRRSLPLLVRISIALMTVVNTQNEDSSPWANDMLEGKVSLVLSELLGQSIHKSCHANPIPAC